MYLCLRSYYKVINILKEKTFIHWQCNLFIPIQYTVFFVCLNVSVSGTGCRLARRWGGGGVEGVTCTCKVQQVVAQLPPVCFCQSWSSVVRVSGKLNASTAALWYYFSKKLHSTSISTCSCKPTLYGYRKLRLKVVYMEISFLCV